MRPVTRRFARPAASMLLCSMAALGADAAAGMPVAVDKPALQPAMLWSQAMATHVLTLSLPGVPAPLAVGVQVEPGDGFVRLRAQGDVTARIVLVGDAASGSLRYQGVDYRVVGRQVYRLDPARAVAPDAGALLPPSPVPGASDKREAPAAVIHAVHTTHDQVLLFLDQSMLTSYGENGARAVGLDHVDLLNQVIANSGLAATIDVVGFDYYNAPSIAVGNNLTPFHGDATVQAKRDAFGADEAFLLMRFTHADGICGLGYEYTPASPTAAYAYSVMGDGSATDGYYCPDSTLAHEWGHTLGANHDYAHTAKSPGGDPYTFSYGYRCGANGADVMSATYLGLNVVNIFSTPNVVMGGVPCGIAYNTALISPQADDAHAVDIDFDTVAAYRNPPTSNGPVGFSDAAQMVAAGVTSVTLHLARSGSVAQAGSVEVAAISDSANNPATEGTDFPTYVHRLTFAAGQSEIDVPVTVTHHGASNRGLLVVARYPVAQTLSGNAQVSVTIDNTAGSGSGGSGASGSGGGGSGAVDPATLGVLALAGAQVLRRRRARAG